MAAFYQDIWLKIFLLQSYLKKYPILSCPLEMLDKVAEHYHNTGIIKEVDIQLILGLADNDVLHEDAKETARKIVNLYRERNGNLTSQAMDSSNEQNYAQSQNYLIADRELQAAIAASVQAAIEAGFFNTANNANTSSNNRFASNKDEKTGSKGKEEAELPSQNMRRNANSHPYVPISNSNNNEDNDWELQRALLESLKLN